MENTRKLFVVALAIFFSSPSDGATGPNKLTRNIPDAFEAFAAFPLALAISDNDNDGIFECLTATRRDFDLEARTATYDWSLGTSAGHEREIVSLHHTAGATPDATNITVGDDDTIFVGFVRYTDYKQCGVTDIPLRNKNECTLWVSAEYKDSVPTHCLRQFGDICGVSVFLRDSDLCPDD